MDLRRPIVSYRKLLLFSLRIFSSYFCVAAIFSFIQKSTSGFVSVAWGERYFLGLVFLLVLASWQIPATDEEDVPELSLADLLFLAVIAVAALYYRFSYIHYNGLWADEFSQVALSNRENAALACAGQSQPPLDCALSAFSQALIGMTELGVRFHSALSSALAAFFLAVNLLWISRSYLLAAAGAFLFSWPDIIFMLGYEVRPVSLGLLFAVLAGAWFTNALRKEKPSAGDFLAFGVSVVFFMLSLGLQAPAFVAILAGVCALMYAITKRSELLRLSGVGVFGILLFLPMQLFVIQRTVPVFRPLSLDSILEWLGAIFSHSFHFFHEVFSIEFNQVTWLLLLSPLPAIIFGLLRDRKNKSWQNLCVAYAACLAVLLVLPAYAHVYIVLPFKARYMLVLWPWLILVSVMSAQYWIDRYPAYRRLAWPSLAVFIFASAIVSKAYSYERIINYPDIRGAYEWVKKEASAGDEVVSICFSYDHLWCQVNMGFQIAGDIYFKEKNGANEPRRLAAQFLFDAFFHNKPINRLVVIDYELGPMKAHFLMNDVLGKSFPQANKAEFDQITVFALAGGTKVIKEKWYALVEKVGERMKGDSVIVDELLMQKAYFEGDAMGFKTYRDRMLRNMDRLRMEDTRNFYRKYFSEKEFP